jgi:hypothetical protein
MANVLSKSNIANSNIIEAWQVSQSVDAFTGIVEYDVTISGSLILTGSQKILGSISSSNGSNTVGFFGTSSWAASASFTTSASYALSSSISISSSYAFSASYALSSSYAFNSNTASYINPASVIPSKFAPSYLMVDSAVYPPATPYAIQGPSSTNIYISASTTVGLQFTSTNVTDGQIINFYSFWAFPNITSTNIAVTASINVYGIGGGTNLVIPGTPKTLDQIGVGPSIKSFTFQYINTPGVNFPAAGWYLININES